MISLPKPPKVVQKKGNKAIFEIESLYPGYGITLGNALRRVLLSSLGGAAITQVKIKGVSHEFSTIPGILEDVVMILLNLKRLRFKMFSQEPQTITLREKGRIGEVKARSFKLSPQLTLVNPEVHIATLTSKKAELNMEAQVETGIGYQSVEEREEKKNEVGVLPLDAIFTPIKQVTFQVENMRVGKRTDFDRLRLEIETDGTLSPEESFKTASEIILQHFSLLLKTAEKKKEKEKERGKKEDLSEIKKMKIEELKIGERTKNALLKNNLKTVGGILRKSERDLLALEGMGEKGIKEIKRALKKLNLELIS